MGWYTETSTAQQNSGLGGVTAMSVDAKEILDHQWESIREPEQSTDPSELSYSERVEHWRERIPEGYSGVYETLLARGCKTPVAAAVSRHFADLHGDAPSMSQAEVAAQFGISTGSIRRWKEELSTVSERE